MLIFNRPLFMANVFPKKCNYNLLINNSIDYAVSHIKNRLKIKLPSGLMI